MQVIKQLEEVQKTILNLQNSKNYYKKQFEASVKDNEILRKQFDKLHNLFLIASCSVFVTTSVAIYSILLIK